MRLSKNAGLYPDCLVLTGVELLSDYAVASGHFGEVWNAQIQGYNVAIKAVRVYATSDIKKITKVTLAVLSKFLDADGISRRRLLEKPSHGLNWRIRMFCRSMVYTT
jgi:hypothetical protein